MGNNYGTGVSRVLDPSGTGFVEVLWQEGKPPCDAELNLLQEIATDWTRKAVIQGTPSGWLGNDTNSSGDFVTSPIWSNWFQFGRQRSGEKRSITWAVVNGWVIPITGTKTGSPPGSPNDTDTWNRITLDPPPANSGDFRTDFAFLEVWLARVPPNPLTLNKPGAAYIYKYGNVEGGANYLGDDLVDPALGFETTERIQLQYRIRVVSGLVGLATYPDGFDPTVVKAQGAATAPTSFTFTNMRKELGDPGLWRAGDGTANSLGTVDGYVYAIPIAAVFRRNSVAWAGDPSPNFNGSFNRNPIATDRTGAKTFSVTGGISDSSPAIPTLASAITASSTTIQLANLSQLPYLPIPTSPANPVLVRLGDELLTYSSITSGGLMTVTRGVNGTRAEAHAAGAQILVQAGRPDNLFADQVAITDILDLRHVVNPNGFDYEALLKNNLDKLLRGKLHANWKRTGTGPQGPFVPYEDKIGTSAATGVTLLDAPDNIRMIFSDVASVQKVEFIAVANADSVLPAEVSDVWTFGDLSVLHTLRGTSSQFSANDILSIPIAQFKVGLPGGDADQVRFVNDHVTGAIQIRVAGETTPIDPSTYTVTPANPTPTDDLVITLGANFPSVASAKQLYITVSVLYGAGRGLSRRPDAIHSVTFANVGSDVLTHHAGVASTHFPLKVGWAPLWSKFRSGLYQSMLPVTAEAYADLGSKTLVLQPFRKISWPSLYTMDGSSANYNPTAIPGASGTGTISSGTISSGTTLTDGTKDFSGTGLNIQVNSAVLITTGLQTGRYNVVQVAPLGNTHQLILDRVLPAGSVTYSIHAAQGLMPLNTNAGVAKWTNTDPLGVFSGQSESAAATKNIYVSLPRHLVPGWGEFRLPIATTSDESTNPNFGEGINFGLISLKGSSYTDSDKNYVPYGFGTSSFAIFTTWNFTGSTPAVYNASVPSLGFTMAGMRKFTDSRGFGRKGLELPPFYGIARLFGVYEAQDYAVNLSAYDVTNRTARTGGSTNLLRQDFDGPLFWVEIDSDGDSTFILNADAIDLSRSPHAVTFDSGNFVIEASIFGFDRDAFDITKEFRLVLTRHINSSTSRSEAINPTRSANIDIPISGPSCVLPGPVGAGGAICSVLIDYSRTPYMGDAWGSQTSYADLAHTAGPLLTGVAWQIANPNNGLLLDSLTRPNQKVLEVLASCGFATTLGTGRLSGDCLVGTQLDMRDAGYEDPPAYPPASGVAARPIVNLGGFEGDVVTNPATQYLGCTERLPLGSLWRDKDFRGGTFGWSINSLLVHTNEEGIASGRSMTQSLMAEYTEVNLSTADTATGQAGECLVHVDGEQGNYALRTNYRTNRGGSVFTASGTHPGGEVLLSYPDVTAPAKQTNVLAGRAFLVRNTVTTVGSSEVSAGDELMLLVVTTVTQLSDHNAHPMWVSIGTNGTSEGWSAADLYRLEGHPLLNDRTHLELDPSIIALPRKAS